MDTTFRLTRRGRFLLVGLPALALTALLAVAAVLFGSASLTPAVASVEAPVAVKTVTVGYGDTLWSIAGEIESDSPRDETVEQIGALNDLGAEPLQPGQVLFLPASS